MIDKLLNQVKFTKEPVGPQTYLVVTSPVLEFTIEIHILSTRQKPHNHSLTCELSTVILRKGRWKLLELLQLTKIISQKKYYFLERL